MSRVTIRQLHAYVGLFIAPSVLFFAVTGELQLFSLHEAHGHYQPPSLIEKLSSVHKDQVFKLGEHHGPPPQAMTADGPDVHAPPPSGPDGDEDRPGPATLLLKIFFLIVGLGLAVSATLGIWLGLTQSRQKRTAWLLTAAGTAIPVALLLL